MDRRIRLEIERNDIMLKIRDDVDLKELEKFGFEIISKNNKLMCVWKNKYFINVVEIDVKTRELINLGDRSGNMVFYDLIKADLVVKDDE